MRLVLGGDVMLGRLVDGRYGDGARSPFEWVRALLEGAALVGVNLECAITAGDTWYTGPPKAFYFRARPWAARCLQEAGVRLVTLANNHALDAGEPGLADTLRLLDAHGIAHAGAGADLAEAARPALLDACGTRFAFLAACDHQPDFAAGPHRPGIRFLDLTNEARARRTLMAEVAQALTLAEAVVVSLHWQPNWVPSVTPACRRLAHACLEAGALAVWGHSPHHFQGVELVDGRAILYSTGGLIDDYAIAPDFRNDRQLLFGLQLEGGHVRAIEAHPIEIRGGAAHPAGPEAAAWIAARYAHACAELGTPVTAEGPLLVVS